MGIILLNTLNTIKMEQQGLTPYFSTFLSVGENETKSHKS